MANCELQEIISCCFLGVHPLLLHNPWSWLGFSPKLPQCFASSSLRFQAFLKIKRKRVLGLFEYFGEALENIVGNQENIF